MGAAIQGSDCLFAVNILGDYTAVVCATSFSLSVASEFVETTTKGDGQWKAFDYNSLSYTLSLSGIVKSQDDTAATVFDLLASQTGFSEVPFRLLFTDGTNNKYVEGTCLISSTQLGASAGNLADYSVEFQGTGSFSVRETLEICESYIPDTLLNVQVRQYPYGSTGTTTVEVQIGTISGAWSRIDYSVDGGSWYSDFYQTFYITGITAGSHTVRLAPVCESGVQGEILSKTFNME